MTFFRPNLIYLLLCAGVLLKPELAFSQYAVTGCIVDIVSGHPVQSVSVSHTNGTTLTQSDLNGAFQFNTGSEQETNAFKIIYNIFYSSYSEDVTLSVFDLMGRNMIKTIEVAPGDTYLFPEIQQGIYLLHLENGAQNKAFKLYSSGNKISLLQKNNYTGLKSAQLRGDTLIFAKEGYFSRRISAPLHDTTLYVEMLQKGQNAVDFLNGIPDYHTFSLLKGSPFVTNQSEVESVKFIYDIHKKLVYFMNSTKYELHYPFAQSVLGYNQGLAHFNATQYTNSSKRYLYLGSINFYKNTGIYVVRFYPGDMMGCGMVKQIIEKIKQVTYFDDDLFFYANNPKWENCSDVPAITSDELFEGQNYQALNLAENYGYLRKIDVANIEDEYPGRHDVVLLNGIPNDIPVVAGIITTEFQTPLSHINVLSHNRNTPNMALRDGWDNRQLEELNGELIYLNVGSDSFEIRKAGIEEAQAFWNFSEPQQEIVLDKDLSVTGLVKMENAGYNSTASIGGKASNFAEMKKVTNPSVPLPEDPFAIPLFYYQQHIEQNNLSGFIEDMLNDESFKNNQLVRKEKLADLRQRIINAPVNPALIELVEKQINHFSKFDAYRFRSSTNAEDLEFFSGAGLYDSYSAKKGDQEKTIANAIRKVWASLWNLRAFEEREYYKISHLSAAMGILCHRSFPDEDANGVVITQNLYNRNPGFIVNTQYKEYSIVFPEPGINHDQLILYSYSLDPGKDFTIEYLSHSNIPELNGQTVLSDKELYELGKYCMRLKEYYYSNIPNNCNCSFDNFGLDIEFKVDSEVQNRKVYIKQVRFY